eukprot:SM000481S16628  [mRNA]  locus=s481:3044:4496:- [translate_table: standard]
MAYIGGPGLAPPPPTAPLPRFYIPDDHPLLLREQQQQQQQQRQLRLLERGGLAIVGNGGGGGGPPLLPALPLDVLPLGGGGGGGGSGGGALPGHFAPPLTFPAVKTRGLPFQCSELDVLDFFAGLDVVDVLLLRRGGRFCGEAFVVFGTPVQVDLALQRNRQNMGRRYVEVFRAKKLEYYSAVASELAHEGGILSVAGPPADPPAFFLGGPGGLAPLRQNPHGGGGSGGGGGGGGGEPRKPTAVLKLRGLPFSVSKEDIIRFFEEYGLSESSIHIVSNAAGRTTGEAFVEFASPEEAVAAMAKDRQMLGTRYVELFPSSREETTRAAIRS